MPLNHASVQNYTCGNSNVPSTFSCLLFIFSLFYYLLLYREDKFMCDQLCRPGVVKTCGFISKTFSLTFRFTNFSIKRCSLTTVSLTFCYQELLTFCLLMFLLSVSKSHLHTDIITNRNEFCLDNLLMSMVPRDHQILWHTFPVWPGLIYQRDVRWLS